jgi:adenylate cyclase
MSEGTKRRLAAIVSADVVGYSRLMGHDEAGTLRRLNAHRSEHIDPLIAKHGGRIVKTTGDGLLLEFPSVVAAVECCVAVQVGMAERNADADDGAIQFRIGVHLCDVIVEGDDIFGDGVNIAARLQEAGEPGGVTISSNAHDSVDGRIEAGFVDGGDQELKNIARPVRVWRWSPNQQAPAETDVAEPDEPLPLPDKPSIAVLAFENMSGDPEQEYFADGIAEDVITALSRFRSLFVIARNSSFTYKGQAVVITQVARELGVRYVVEGSVRKAGNRVRITAQLIDAANGNHLWADRFDGSLDDVFDLQDQITEQIVIAVEPEIHVRERERAERKTPESLDAWELMQRGLSHFYRFNKNDRTEAVRLFQEAAVLDPGFAAAHAHLAYALWNSMQYGYAEDAAKAAISARAEAEQAVSLDPNEPMARFALGRLHIMHGEFEMALGEMQTAISVNPNFAWGHYGIGFAYHWSAGQAELSLPFYDTALRLSPRDPLRWRTLMLKGSALRMIGRYEEAITHCRQACHFPDVGFLPHMNLAASLALAGHATEARKMAEKTTELRPDFSIDFVRTRLVGMHDSVLTRLIDGLRKAGVPEE